MAEYFRFGCERQLRYDLVPPERRGGEVPAYNADPAAGPLIGPRPGSALLTAAGRRWERRALGRLIARTGAERVAFAGWRAGSEPARLRPERVAELLRDPGEIDFLVQPELRLADPAAFLAEYGIAPALVELAPAAPDLIRVRRGPRGQLRFQVVDIKASREARVPHFAQVAFYTLLLEAVCREAGVDAQLVDTRWARVWARDGRGARTFRLGAYRHHVRRFLRDELPRLAALAPAEVDWHVAPRCAGCTYLEHCRAEADTSDAVCRVAGLTPLAGRVLREKGITTVAALAKSHRKDTWAGCHALETDAELLKLRAQATGWKKLFETRTPTQLMSAHEDVRIVLSAEGDPVRGRCFALGARVEGLAGRGGAESHVFLAEAPTAVAERAMLGRMLATVAEAFSAVERANCERAGRPLSAHLYVWDRAELAVLQDLIERQLTGDNGGLPDDIPAALALLLRFFAAGGANAAERSPGTVVADVVRTLFALPIPYAYDLASVSACLQPVEGGAVYRPAPEYALPFSSQLAFEPVHRVWGARRSRPAAVGVVSAGASAAKDRADATTEEIRATVAAKLAAVGSVVRAVRERASRKERLQLRAEPFAPAAPEPSLGDPALETLRLFTRVEALAEAAQIRALHALPTLERARRFECIRDLHLVERSDDGTLVFDFDPDCREAKFRPGDFNLVLTNDDGNTLGETDRHVWRRRALMVELVGFDLTGERPRVRLAPGSGFRKAEEQGWIDLDRVCVLDRAASDYNTPRVLATLEALAAGAGEADFARGLLYGRVSAGWSVSDTPPGADTVAAVEREVLGAAGAAYGRAVLNADQHHAWRAAFEQPVSLVWGPPGTGKTYLLAWMLIGLAAAARREGRPLRVLVTAATHRAIANVLVRAARELEASGIEAPLELVKLRGSGSESDAELEASGVELLDDAKLRARLEQADATGTPLVAGSTVWSLWKQMRAASKATDGSDTPVQPWFDVVVIDEASQMKVGDALIALSSVRRGARVVLCGDDRQLAPVIRGRYSAEASPLFGSVFTHFATHFPRQILRESRRMNRALVDYPRRLFYPGLVSRVPEQRLHLVRPAPMLPDAVDALLAKLFLDPDDAIVLCTYSGVRAAQRNPFEAALAARLARLARTLLADPATGQAWDDARFAEHALALISPHRAQNSAILAELLAAGFAPDALPVADTVERMQGNEREMIVVSYAVADREYAEREAEFLLHPNRFNVSITRARSKLVVLLSEEILRALPRDEAVLADSAAIQEYRDHCQDGVREVVLPAPDGTTVPARLHYRKLDA